MKKNHSPNEVPNFFGLTQEHTHTHTYIYVYNFIKRKIKKKILSSSWMEVPFFQNCAMKKRNTKFNEKEFLLIFSPRLDIIDLDYL